MTRTYVAAALLAIYTAAFPVHVRAETASELLDRGYICTIIASESLECSRPGAPDWHCSQGTCQPHSETSSGHAGIFDEAIAEMMTY